MLIRQAGMPHKKSQRLWVIIMNGLLLSAIIKQLIKSTINILTLVQDLILHDLIRHYKLIIRSCRAFIVLKDIFIHKYVLAKCDQHRFQSQLVRRHFCAQSWPVKFWCLEASVFQETIHTCMWVFDIILVEWSTPFAVVYLNFISP